MNLQWDQRMVLNACRLEYNPNITEEQFIQEYSHLMDKILKRKYNYNPEITTLEDYAKDYWIHLIPNEIIDYVDWERLGESLCDSHIIVNRYGTVVWWD